MPSGCQSLASCSICEINERASASASLAYVTAHLADGVFQLACMKKAPGACAKRFRYLPHGAGSRT